MNKIESIKNFLKYLPTKKTLVFVYQPTYYQDIVNEIKCYLETHSLSEAIFFSTELSENLNLLSSIITSSTNIHFVLFYNAVSTETANNEILKMLRKFYITNRDECTKVNDVYDQFFEMYKRSPNEIVELNRYLLNKASNATQIIIADHEGNYIKSTPSHNIKEWFNVDGYHHNEITVSEIAMKPMDLTGTICFSGSIFCKVPFYKKYNIINDKVYITVENSVIGKIESINKQLEADLNHFINLHNGNKKIEELGIGTNPNLKVTGLNTICEERKAGFHLGIGGEDHGSIHLDLIFSDSKIYFDTELIFDKNTFF